MYQIVDAQGKPLKLFDCNDVPVTNAFEIKAEAKDYRRKVDGTFASYVSYGCDHPKYNPKRLPRNNKGRHPKKIKARTKAFF